MSPAYKNILKTLLFVILISSVSFIYIVIDKELIYPSDYLKSEKTKKQERRARVQLLKSTVNQSAKILQKTLYAIDGNRTTQSIDSKNIFYAISNKEIFSAVPTPYINSKKIPDYNYSLQKIKYVIDEILLAPYFKLEKNIQDAEDIRSINWYGDMNVSKMNDGKKVVFVTVKRSILDKALKDSVYKKEFQHYMWNTLNHEAVHMLGEDEYFAAKYGQTQDVNTSSEFFEDIVREDIFKVLKNKYDNNTFDYFSEFVDRIFTIKIKHNDPNKTKILSMIDVIKKNKDTVYIVDRRHKEEQFGTNKRASWINTHNKSVANEYHLILTRGERFLAKTVGILNTAYWKSITTGLYYNMYQLLKEKGYSQQDMELLNSLIVSSVLKFEYGYQGANQTPGVMKNAENSLNKLVSICFEDQTTTNDDDLANGILYFNGNLVEKDYVKAKKYLTLASGHGSIRAKSLLGLMYHYGLGIKKNLHKALEFYKELDSYDAMGWVYYTGDKSIQNYKEAYNNFGTAAAFGSPAGRSSIGLMYVRGQYVEVDYNMAIKQFKKVLKNYELANTLNNMAWMYLNGLGVKQDTQKAIKLFEKAAKGRSTSAILNLEWIYSTNEFNLKNIDKEKYWHKRVQNIKQRMLDDDYELCYIRDRK